MKKLSWYDIEIIGQRGTTRIPNTSSRHAESAAEAQKQAKKWFKDKNPGATITEIKTKRKW